MFLDLSFYGLYNGNVFVYIDVYDEKYIVVEVYFVYVVYNFVYEGLEYLLISSSNGLEGKSGKKE